MTFISKFDDDSIRLDGSLLADLIDSSAINSLQDDINGAVKRLHDGTGEGSDFLGWLDPMSMLDDDELVRIRDTAKRLRDEVDNLVVIGIGGSYLGAKACFDALRPCGNRKDGHAIHFAGINLSAQYHKNLLDSLRNKKFAINVISKSGTTTEPAVAFRLFRAALNECVGPSETGKLIVATTDKNKGALRKLADSRGWDSFAVPDNVGGRYSVLTPVGLLPLAFAGIDIDALVGGATECSIACREKTYERNPVRLYAAFRHLLYKSGKSIELFAAFEPRFAQLIEWWKQLYGESEGKNGSGLFPAGVIYTRDLHSLGQWVQDGPRILFETFLTIENGEPSMVIPEIPGESSDDGLCYLEGRELSEINKYTCEAVRMAHSDGGCPNMGLYVPKLDAYHLGVLIYFFEYACALSGYLNGVNPFDQPGVEVYKKNMFALLGKPGCEKEA